VKLPEGSEGRPSFGSKPKDVLFSKQVQKAEGRAFFKTSSLPSASFGKPPEVKLAEGRKQVRFLRKAATPPEVKLPEGSRRTPPEVKLLSESRQR